MPATRPRRIVRRAAMALVVVVLLPIGYVGVFTYLAFAQSAGWLPGYVDAIGNVADDPAESYMEADLPGSDALEEIFRRVHQAGKRFR